MGKARCEEKSVLVKRDKQRGDTGELLESGKPVCGLF
jgi:hypothetical protein